MTLLFGPSLKLYKQQPEYILYINYLLQNQRFSTIIKRT